MMFYDVFPEACILYMNENMLFMYDDLLLQCFFINLYIVVVDAI